MAEKRTKKVWQVLYAAAWLKVSQKGPDAAHEALRLRCLWHRPAAEVLSKNRTHGCSGKGSIRLLLSCEDHVSVRTRMYLITGRFRTDTGDCGVREEDAQEPAARRVRQERTACPSRTRLIAGGSCLGSWRQQNLPERCRKVRTEHLNRQRLPHRSGARDARVASSEGVILPGVHSHLCERVT